MEGEQLSSDLHLSVYCACAHTSTKVLFKKKMYGRRWVNQSLTTLPSVVKTTWAWYQWGHGKKGKTENESRVLLDSEKYPGSNQGATVDQSSTRNPGHLRKDGLGSEANEPSSSQIPRVPQALHSEACMSWQRAQGHLAM